MRFRRGKRSSGGGRGFRLMGFNILSSKFIIPLIVGAVVVVLSPKIYVKLLGILKPGGSN